MNSRQTRLNQLKELINPVGPDYCIHDSTTGKFYMIDDIDFSTSKPKPGAIGKTIERHGQIYRYGNLDIYF